MKAVGVLERYGWWSTLNHGGLLIAPAKLAEHYPEQIDPLPAWKVDRLRRDLVRLNGDGDDGATRLIDTVLEEVADLSKPGWVKGSDVDRSWSRKLITGEVARPRRVWFSANGFALPVFVTDGEGGKGAARLGVGKGKRAVARVVEWLRHANRKVALLTNGRQFRLIHAGSDYDAFCEWDTELWFQEGGPGPQVEALRILLSRGSLTPKAEGELPRLLQVIQASREGQAELSSALGERVRLAVEELIKQSAPALEAIDVPGPAHVSRRDIYIAASRVIMRCVAVLFAEARELLPRSNAIYEASYGLQGLRAQLDRQAGGRAREQLRHRHSAWPRLLSLFSLVYEGSAHEALPVARYGGGLFTPGDPESTDPVLRALAAFEGPQNNPSDASIHRILELLCRTRVRVRQGRASRTVEAPVDFSDLSSEYIGILYEGLLDFELRRAPQDDAMIFLNLGDQPALPLKRLDGMPNDELGKLLGKLKQANRQEAAEEEAEDETGELEETELGEAEQESEAAETDEAVEDQPQEDDGDSDRATRELIQIWAERAVKAAKLVPYPRNDRDARVRDQFASAVTAKARSLVAKSVLPGDWFLVRWGGTRKGSGTFYTRPQLAGPIVRRALQALCYEEGKTADGELVPRRPEEILALKVCDPAMGSGSFLVSALRYLTDAVLESLHHHQRLAGDGDHTVCRLADGLPAGRPTEETLPVPLDAPDFDERLRARLKRYVVERCLYGVDIDPLAVELAKMALWVETMDYRLPFGFLDHKLKCGNSLVGCWFDRFQDYPILAWEREGGDKDHKRFVRHHHEVADKKGNAKKAGDKWTSAIKAARSDVVRPGLASWIMQRKAAAIGQSVSDFYFEGKAPADVHGEAMRTLQSLHDLPVTDAEKRGEVYREQILGSSALRRLREAFDTWCAVWFWPGDELEHAPGAKDLGAPSDAMLATARRLRGEVGFFHWELEFPDVFAGREAGFDAIVGNPPWEIQKPNSMEFFSNRDPLYRTYGKQEGLDRQQQLFEETDDCEHDWLTYSARFKAMSNWTKNVAFPFGKEGENGTAVSLARGNEGAVLAAEWERQRAGRATYADAAHPFRLQGSADINTYKMFLEIGHALLRKGGVFGFLVPSGLYTDNGTGDLRDTLLNRCGWTHLYAFQNERFVFENIHHSFKMAVVHVRKGGSTDELLTRFRLGPGDWPETREVEEDLLDAKKYLPLPSTRIHRFSPNTGSILEVRSKRDLEILEKLYDNGVLLGDQGPDGWGIKYAREFDMTNDSQLFPPRPKWEADGYRADEYGHWLKGKWRKWDGPKGILERPAGTVLSQDGEAVIDVDAVEDVALPLYQGVMVQQFDFSKKGWLERTGLRAKWRGIGFAEKAIEPQFLMARDAYVSRDGAVRRAKVAFRDIARSTDERTYIAALLPDCPCGNVLGVFATALPDRPALLACLDSFPLDWVLRERIGGTHLNYYIVEELPLCRRSPRDLHEAAGECSRALSWGSCAFAAEWQPLSEPAVSRRAWKRMWGITEYERLRLRAMLDAVVARLYGLSPNDLRHILRECDHPMESVAETTFSRSLNPKGFWRAERQQPPELRHTVLTQVAATELAQVGLDTFLNQNGGEGWMLPETLRLADYGLGHDARAKEHQPVASRLGPRFLPWQLEVSAEESWEECRRHAELIRQIVPAPGETQSAAEPAAPPKPTQGPAQQSLFGGDDAAPPTRRKRR